MRIHFFLFIFILFSSCTGQKQFENLSEKNEKVPSAKNIKDKIEFEIDCSIRALAIENDSICWFTGSKNKFGFTKDFGKSWQTFSIEYDTLDLQFRSIGMTKNAVFILSIGTPALLFKIDKHTLKYELVYKEIGENVFYDSMQFWDNENGIAVGDPTGNCMSVLLTKDGGNTWKKLACENLPLASEGEAAFAASNTNISLADRKAFIVTGGKAANVLVSDEFGKSWKKIKTPIAQGEKMTGIFSSHFFDSKIGIIAGGNWEEKANMERAMAITNDGGNSWQLVEENPGYISCVQFVPNTKKVLACSTNGIFYSEYLGESWKKVSEEGYYSFRISENGERLYFAGNNKLMSINVATLLGK